MVGVSPEASAFLSTQFNDIATSHGVQLSESSKRTQCSYCNTLLVSGLTIEYTKLTQSRHGKQSRRKPKKSKLNSTDSGDKGCSSTKTYELKLTRDLEAIRSIRNSLSDTSKTISSHSGRKAKLKFSKNINNYVDTKCRACRHTLRLSGSFRDHVRSLEAQRKQFKGVPEVKDNVGIMSLPSNTVANTPKSTTSTASTKQLQNNTKQTQLGQKQSKSSKQQLQSPTLLLSASTSNNSNKKKKKKSNKSALKALLQSESSKSGSSGGKLKLGDFLSTL
ncbi:hypothetical protein H4219_004698 [Mycoemilia scoparia]|uniref:Uncharacterized protein n=1 Tax=Mycoemilia scoparia TaxID=417184 RepID=A0A9W8DRF4_9FUNG|nr:hypothetical protein H4219_004698 [Mycoemilia scoparia]